MKRRGFIHCISVLFISLLFVGCSSAPVTTEVRNVGEWEMWVSEFRFGNCRPPVGFLSAGATATAVNYSCPVVPEAAYFKWRRYGESEEDELEVEIKRPLPKRGLGQEYKVTFEIDTDIKVFVKTEPQ